MIEIGSETMNIAVLHTHLFPDPETVAEAVTHLEPHHNVYRYDVRQGGLSDDEWDQMLDEILAADRVITV